MNDLNDFSPTGSQADSPTTEAQPTPVGFCQNCGTGLTAQTARAVGQAVFCEPCLEARLAGTPTGAAYPPPPPGYTPVDTGAPGAGWVNPPSIPGTPNPGLAALLGFIPGVGAMYNEQYAKGFVHLLVFIVLVTLTDNVNGVFGIAIAGWEFYMAIEAHHTARARRDGLALPNPFGLNDIGERLGFGKTFTAAGSAQPAGGSQSAPWNFSHKPSQASAAAGSTVPPAAQAQAPSWGAPADAYGPAYVAPAWNATYGPAPAMPPYVPPATNRFPAGAVWLIGLGSLFLLMTTGIFESLHVNALIGCVLIGLGTWSFIRRMTEAGGSLANDGTPLYRMRVFHALRLAVWLDFIGLWFLLISFHLVRWHIWPVFLILAGVMTLLERLVFYPVAASYPPAAAATDSSQKGGN